MLIFLLTKTLKTNCYALSRVTRLIACNTVRLVYLYIKRNYLYYLTGTNFVKMVKLNKEESKLVIDCWKNLPVTMFDLGEKVMYKLFEKYPYNQQEFPKFRNVDLEELKGKPSFRVHASRIINRFDATIDCLQHALKHPDTSDEASAEIKEIWREIGESHGARKITRRSFLVNLFST